MSKRETGGAKTKSVLCFGESLEGSWPVGPSPGGQGMHTLCVCVCVCVCVCIGMLLFAE